MMDDLVTWLRAVLDEDEAVASNADGEHYWIDDGDRTIRFLEHHTPASVLRDVAAKRAIVDAAVAAISDVDGHTGPFRFPEDETIGAADAYRQVLRHLAAACEDRDGYRPEWRPERNEA